jgi:pilus assembly protein FimV
MNRPPKKTIVAALGGVLLALSAAFANAAGLGKLTVNSALGQPLSAEIELVSLQPGEFEVLSARTASPEAYTEARIEFSPLLRQLRYAIERRANGTPILKISSSAPINEPFLDVLVEMTWPSGRLVREYPILLDPPGFNEAKILSPVAAVTPRPAAASSPAQPAAVVPSAAAVRAETVAASNKGDTYGPVKRGDTLAKIANEMKADGVSLDQMLVALYRENRQAFLNNNMNLLKTGQILRIPSAADVAKLTKAEASKEVQVQVADWKGYREQIASAAAAAPAKPAPTNVATGQVTPAKPVAPPPAAATDQLKIAKADTTGKAGAAGAKGGVDAANAAKEDAIAKQKAMDEAKARIAALEKQQADAKKLVELKTAPPATAKPADTKSADAKAAAPTQVAQVSTTPGAPVAPATATPPVSAPATPATSGVQPPASGAASTPAPAPGAPVTEAVKPATDIPKTDAAKPAPPKVPAKTPPPPPPQEPELMDTVMENLPIIAGVGGAGVLAVGGLLFMRRRRQNTTSMGATTQTSSLMPSDLKPNTVTGNKAGGLVDTGNSSFLTDFDKTGPGSIDTDEVDPVAEAEVYIAYGRDAQAEEILKEAMMRDKSRHEISMKLLEIYHARKSAPAFETVARELRDAVGENDPLWAKAAAMGSAIDPSNDLYGGARADATGSFAAGGTMAMAAAGAASADASKPDLDFDLGFDDTTTMKAPDVAFDVTAPNTDQPAVAAMDTGSMDFDLDLAAEAPAAPQPATLSDIDLPTSTTTSDASNIGLDFDLALDVPDVAAPVATTLSAAPAASGFDFDLSSLSLDAPAVAAPAAAPAPGLSLDLGGLSLDLDSPSSSAVGGAADVSAVATKLELAKAYIEIGDSDGAREILNEVVREGSAAQAAEAKTILGGM